jgi:hypothetical protein
LAARTAFWRHGDSVVNSGGGGDEQAFRTVARNDHFSVVSAFEDAFKSIEAQTGAGSIFAVAPDAGGLKKGFDIFVERHALSGGGGREFGDIDFADVPRIFLLLRNE